MSGGIPDLDKVAARFDVAANVTSDKVRSRLARAGHYLAGYIAREKLSGQVLHARSSRLRGSIDYVEQVSGDNIKGLVGSLRGVPYAAVHEFGGTFGVTRTSTLGKVFSYNATYPQRSFVRSALNEQGKMIFQIVSTGLVVETLR